MKVLKKIMKYSDSVIFDVFINIHGRGGHIEKFKINRHDFEKAEKLGYSSKAYFDFKPLFKTNIQGGLFKVNTVRHDNKYTYFNTNVGDFSLPKYLTDKLPTQEYVFFGKRVY